MVVNYMLLDFLSRQHIESNPRFQRTLKTTDQAEFIIYFLTYRTFSNHNQNLHKAAMIDKQNSRIPKLNRCSTVKHNQPLQLTIQPVHPINLYE